MNDLRSLLKLAGFQPRTAATSLAIAGLEKAFDVILPKDWSEFWAFSDGSDGNGIELLSLARVLKYGRGFAGRFGYVPFTDCNDSNPYIVCCRDPLRGMVVHVFHDDEAQLVCRGVRRFLQLVAEAGDRGFDVDLLEGDLSFERAPRSAEDLTTARELVHLAEQMDKHDDWRTDTLRFAAQLFGPGQEDELSHVMALGNEYVREAVLRRWKGLGTADAQRRIFDDAVAYREFLAEFRKRIEAAGIETDANRDGTFRLRPGNEGLNFAMLFAECWYSNGMDACVQHIKERMSAEGPPGVDFRLRLLREGQRKR